MGRAEYRNRLMGRETCDIDPAPYGSQRGGIAFWSCHHVAASASAQIAADRQVTGRPMSEADSQIEAVTRSRIMAVVTRNVRDFADAGIDVINPCANDNLSRSFNYSILASELVYRLEVRKSPEADRDEGSLGGAVNIRTRRPVPSPLFSYSTGWAVGRTAC